MKKPVFEEEAYEYYRHPGDPDPSRAQWNGRWGNVERLFTRSNTNGKTTSTFVMVPTVPTPRPVAFLIRFSIDGVTWHATNPSSTATVTFRLTEQIDLKAGEVIDTFSCSQDQGQPFSQIITTGLTMTATISSSDEFNPDALFVSVAACPVCCVDGDVSPDVTPPATVTRPQAWSLSGRNRFSIAEIVAAQPTPFPVLTADTDRSQFFVSNRSNVEVMVSLGPGAILDPGADFGSFVLQPGDTYESPPGGYSGGVTVAVETGAVDADGCVLVTEGTYS